MKTKIWIAFTFLLLSIEARSQFFTQTILSDLNQHPNNLAAYAISTNSLNRPTEYGTILGLRFWDGGGSDWRTQLAFGTNNDFYYRQSTNSSGTYWTDWYKVYHSGNFNPSLYLGRTSSNISSSGSINNFTNGQTFAYSSSGSPWNGALLSFGGFTSEYDCQINADYGPNGGRHISFRTRNGDNGTWNGWNEIFHSGNFCKSDVDFSCKNLVSFGNVVIGKTSQTNTAYKLDIAGKIRADEIVVNTTGADFVFDSTYNLRTLPELEAFIKQNKHLPEIAPAKEMQENGVSAGEMQTKLLQKIEELTLYVIEQQKLIEKQNKRIIQLEKGTKLQ